jgi:hypothetical protein
MSRRTLVLWIASILALAGLGIGIGAFVSRGNDTAPTASATQSPTTPVTTSTAPSSVPTEPITPSNPMVMPDVAAHALDKSAQAQPFNDSLTFNVPLTWSSRQPEPGVIDYADMTNCQDTASCPHITFIDLTDMDMSNKYGNSDPAGVWAKQSTCSTDTKGKLLGPVEGTINGQRVLYYRQPCGKDPYANFNAVWYLPSQSLLVAGVSGPAASLSAEDVQAVLNSANWR